MHQRNIHFRPEGDYSSQLNLAKHRRTKSKTLITYENNGTTFSRLDPVSNYSKEPFPKTGLDDLAFTKASTLQLEIVEDNAYLKSSIRYFQR